MERTIRLPRLRPMVVAVVFNVFSKALAPADFFFFVLVVRLVVAPDFDTFRKLELQFVYNVLVMDFATPGLGVARQKWRTFASCL